MKKYFMILGLSLVAGVGIFALTESLAGANLTANVFSHAGCGCETCGADCDCVEGTTCGDIACGCGEEVSATCDGSCGGDCSSAGECGAADCGCSSGESATCSGAGSCSGGSSCSEKGETSSCGLKAPLTSASQEEAVAGCGCGTHA